MQMFMYNSSKVGDFYGLTILENRAVCAFIGVECGGKAVF